MDNPVKPDPKKNYEPPRLIVYGTIRDLTQKVGSLKTFDGGSLPAFRTAAR